MGIPIVVKSSGGLPVTLVSNGFGTPMEIANNGFGLAVTVVASGGLPVTGFTTGPDVTAPIIVSASAISQPEESVLTHYLMANEAVTWAKVGGADAAAFTLGSGATAGQLTLPAKNYETEAHTWVVQVRATDAASNVSAIQTITVTITDVDEPASGVGPTIDLVPASDSGAASFDDITNINTPTFNYDFTAVGAVAGDACETFDNGSMINSHVLTGPDLAGGDIDLGLTALADGTHLIKARINRVVGGPSNYGNTITLLVDTAAPTLTSPTAVQATQTTATLGITTNDGSGALYLVVTTSATLPTAAQVKAGLDHTGAVALFNEVRPVTIVGTKSSTATSITNGTRFAHYMHEDAAGNQSTVSNVSWVQADITAPVLTAQLAASSGTTTANLGVTTDETNGTLYGVLTLNSTAPSKAQIKAGQNAAGAAAAYAFNQAVATTNQTKSATGLTTATNYFAWYMHEDAAGNQSNVPTFASFTTGAGDTTAPVLSSPIGTQTGSTTANLGVTTDETNGTLYGVLVLTSSTPSKAQIKAGQNSAGAAAAYAFNQAVSTTTPTKAATGLTASTTYFAYYMHEDTATNQSNIPTVVSFTTAAGATATTWDNSKKSVDISVNTGGDRLTATRTANTVGNWCGLLAVSGKSSGKHYFECVLNDLSIVGSGVGIGTASADLNNYIGADSQSAGVLGDGSFDLNSSFGPAINTFVSGDTVSICIDLDASPKLFWARTNAGNWNNSGTANPATGVGGVSLAAIAAGPYYPMAQIRTLGSGTAVGNFNTAAPTQSIPSGFANNW